MTEQVKQKLKYWLIGLFTGGAVGVPITAYAVKTIYEKKMSEAVVKAADEAETRGMNAMAEYAIQQQSDQNDKILTEEDYAAPTDYDVSIDGEEDAEEAQLRTEAHERYLDMIDKYNGNLDMIPYMIDAEKFINEAYMEKSYVNWYEQDDVFEEDLLTIDDPYASFGVTSGNELFRNTEGRQDPDICYIRNEKLTTDFEISRIHGSYAQMVGGEGSLGKTDT